MSDEDEEKKGKVKELIGDGTIVPRSLYSRTEANFVPHSTRSSNIFFHGRYIENGVCNSCNVFICGEDIYRPTCEYFYCNFKYCKKCIAGNQILEIKEGMICWGNSNACILHSLPGRTNEYQKRTNKICKNHVNVKMFGNKIDEYLLCKICCYLSNQNVDGIIMYGPGFLYPSCVIGGNKYDSKSKILIDRLYKSDNLIYNFIKSSVEQHIIPDLTNIVLEYVDFD